MQKLTAAAKEIDEQQSQIFRLEVRLAEANKKLEHTADLEKELLHYRYCMTCVTSNSFFKLSVDQFEPRMPPPAELHFMSIRRIAVLMLLLQQVNTITVVPTVTSPLSVMALF